MAIDDSAGYWFGSMMIAIVLGLVCGAVWYERQPDVIAANHAEAIERLKHATERLQADLGSDPALSDCTGKILENGVTLVRCPNSQVTTTQTVGKQRKTTVTNTE